MHTNRYKIQLLIKISREERFPVTKRILLCIILCFSLGFQLPCHADSDTEVTVTVNITLPGGAVAADDIVGYVDLVPTDESVLLCAVNNVQSWSELNDIICSNADLIGIPMSRYYSLTVHQKAEVMQRVAGKKYRAFNDFIHKLHESIAAVEKQSSSSGSSGGGGSSSSESGDGDDGNGKNGENGENTETTAYLLSVKNDYFVSDELKDAFNTALSTTENVTIGCGGGNSGSGRNSGGSSSGGGGNYLIPTSILVTKGESGGTLSVSVPDEYLDADYTFKLKLSNIHGDGAYFPDTYYGAGNGSSPYEDGAARFTLDDAPINVELINCEISDFESVGGVSGSLLLAGSINEVAPAVRINNNSDEKLRNVAVYMANYSDSHKLISLTKLTKDRIAVGATASFVFEKTDLTAAPETKLLVWKNDIKPLFVKINLPR